MQISINYVLVEKIPEKPSDGEFKVVEVTDDFVYKGRVIQVPAAVPVYIDNDHVTVGSDILFAKYSPDTYEIEHEGRKVKFVKISDILAKL